MFVGERYMRKHIILLLPLAILGVSSAQATPSVATAEYVKGIVNALGVPEISNKLAQHIGSTDNPHAVTAEQVGLGNVKNVDSTNADNITTGTLNIARLPVGTAAGTVASGTDGRFDTLPTTEPAGDVPEGRVYVWFN